MSKQEIAMYCVSVSYTRMLLLRSVYVYNVLLYEMTCLAIYMLYHKERGNYAKHDLLLIIIIIIIIIMIVIITT